MNLLDLGTREKKKWCNNQRQKKRKNRSWSLKKESKKRSDKSEINIFDWRRKIFKKKCEYLL